MEDTGLELPADRAARPLDIKGAIADAVTAILPPGKSGAAAAIIDADGSQHFVIVQKIGDAWKVAGELDHRDGSPVAGRVLVSGSW